MRSTIGVIAAIGLLSGFQAPPKPEQELVGLAKTYLSMSLPTDWEGLDQLPGIKWAPSATMLQNCLPDGGCFTRQGALTLGGRNLTVIATGARTMVFNIYFRNPSRPLGEVAVVAALKVAGLSAELARCPVRSGAGGTQWYRLRGEQVAPAFLSIQGATTARPTEGFVLSLGEDLPQLQPNQLALYSEQCAAGATRAPVSTQKPHELLAATVFALLPPASGPALRDWETLTSLSIGIEWTPGGPKPMDLTFKSDPNPVSQTGALTLAGRKFSVHVSGTATQPKTIYLDEGGMHPRGEHMLGVLYEKGTIVQLVRCGPVYTESTHMWYSVTSSKTRPAMILQAIRYEGNQVQDSYALRLDGTLPTRDPRDRNPGANGC